MSTVAERIAALNAKKKADEPAAAPTVQRTTSARWQKPMPVETKTPEPSKSALSPKSVIISSQGGKATPSWLNKTTPASAPVNAASKPVQSFIKPSSPASSPPSSPPPVVLKSEPPKLASASKSIGVAPAQALRPSQAVAPAKQTTAPVFTSKPSETIPDPTPRPVKQAELSPPVESVAPSPPLEALKAVVEDVKAPEPAQKSAEAVEVKVVEVAAIITEAAPVVVESKADVVVESNSESSSEEVVTKAATENSIEPSAPIVVPPPLPPSRNQVPSSPVEPDSVVLTETPKVDDNNSSVPAESKVEESESAPLDRSSPPEQKEIETLPPPPAPLLDLLPPPPPPPHEEEEDIRPPSPDASKPPPLETRRSVRFGPGGDVKVEEFAYDDLVMTVDVDEPPTPTPSDPGNGDDSKPRRRSSIGQKVVSILKRASRSSTKAKEDDGDASKRVNGISWG